MRSKHKKYHLYMSCREASNGKSTWTNGRFHLCMIWCLYASRNWRLHLKMFETNVAEESYLFSKNRVLSLWNNFFK